MLFWGVQLMALTQLLIPTLLSSDLGAKKTRSNIRAAVDITVGCLLAPLLGQAVAREEAQGVTVSSPSQDLGSSPWLLSQPAVLLTGAGGGRDLQLLHFTQPEPVGLVHLSTYGAQLTHFCSPVIVCGSRDWGKAAGISVRAAGKAPSQHNPTCCPWDRAVHSPFPRFSRCTERGHPPHHPLPPLGPSPGSFLLDGAVLGLLHRRQDTKGAPSPGGDHHCSSQAARGNELRLRIQQLPPARYL